MKGGGLFNQTLAWTTSKRESGDDNPTDRLNIIESNNEQEYSPFLEIDRALALHYDAAAEIARGLECVYKTLDTSQSKL